MQDSVNIKFNQIVQQAQEDVIKSKPEYSKFKSVGQLTKPDLDSKEYGEFIESVRRKCSANEYLKTLSFTELNELMRSNDTNAIKGSVLVHFEGVLTRKVIDAISPNGMRNTIEAQFSAIQKIVGQNTSDLEYIVPIMARGSDTNIPLLNEVMKHYGNKMPQKIIDDLVEEEAKRKEPNLELVKVLLENGASLEEAAKAFINHPEALNLVLDSDKQNVVNKASLLGDAISANNKESVNAIIAAGAKVEYQHLNTAVAEVKEDFGIVQILLQNGAPTQSTDRATSILSSIENHPKKDEITGLIAQHEALRKGFEGLKTELLKLQDFKGVNEAELMGIIRKVMLEEGGPVHEYFKKVGFGSVARSVDGDGVTNEEFAPNKDKAESFAKEFVNEISLTYWEEFKIWFISIFSEETQAQLRAELITPQLDALFKKEIFGAVMKEVQSGIPAENRDAASAVENKRDAVQEEVAPQKKSFAQMLIEKRGQAPSQDHGRGSV